jgi:hypothetical protein
MATEEPTNRQYSQNHKTGKKQHRPGGHGKRQDPNRNNRDSDEERTALAIAGNLAVDNLEAEWKRASLRGTEVLWQQIDAKQSLGETRLYQVLHAFVFNDDYQPTPTLLRQTDVERLHEMLALLRELRNQYSHWHTIAPTIPDELVGLLCMRFEQAVQHCARQSQFTLFAYGELIAGFQNEQKAADGHKPVAEVNAHARETKIPPQKHAGDGEHTVDYRRQYLVEERDSGKPRLTPAGAVFFLSFFLSTQQVQRLLSQLPGFYKTFKTRHLFRRAVLCQFSRRDAHSALGAAAASRDDDQAAQRNALFAQDELIRSAQTLIDLPKALEAPCKQPEMTSELAHTLGVTDSRLEQHQARWLRRAVAYLAARLAEENQGLAARVQWRSRPRHEADAMEDQALAKDAPLALLGKARAPRRNWLCSGVLDSGKLAVDHGHVHCRLQYSRTGQPPIFVYWKLHARAVRAVLEAHFLYEIPIQSLFTKLGDEGQKWRWGGRFEYLKETDLPPKLRRFHEENPAAPDILDALKAHIDNRLRVLIGRMDRIEKVLHQPFSPLLDPKPERKSAARKPREARIQLQEHNAGHHRHAKNRLILRVYQSFLPREHKLKPAQVQILSIYHYTIHQRCSGIAAGQSVEAAESRMIDKARDALSRLPAKLQTLVFGAESAPGPRDMNELLLRVTRYASEQWQALRGEVPAYNSQQTVQRARDLHLAVPAGLSDATETGSEAAATPAADNQPSSFALPLKRRAVSAIARKFAEKHPDFHASTRHWAETLRKREADERFAVDYYREKINQAPPRRREREYWQDFWSDAAVLSAIAGYWHRRCYPAVMDFVFDADFLNRKLQWTLLDERNGARSYTLNLSIAEAARLRLLSHRGKTARLAAWCEARGDEVATLGAEDLRGAHDDIHCQGREVIAACLRLERLLMPSLPSPGDQYYYPFTEILEWVNSPDGIDQHTVEQVKKARNCALHVDIPADAALFAQALESLRLWLADLESKQ